MLVWVYFCSKFFHLQLHSHLPQLNFSVFLNWKYSIVTLYMHILSNISHTFKPNQAPNVASSVGYIISRSAKFCAPALVHVQTMPKTFIRNASLELISHHLPCTNSKLNSTWLCKENHDWIYETTVGHDAGIFSVPKILRLHVQPLLSKWHLHETLPNNLHLENNHFRTVVC